MAQDKLLIASTDLQNIKGNLSSNVEAPQIDPYIIEAQTGEIRRFLGDELYLELLNEFDPLASDTANTYEFILTDGTWTRFGAGAHVPNFGWGINFTPQLGITSPLLTAAFTDLLPFTGSFEVDFNDGPADNMDVQLLDSTSVVKDSVLNIPITSSGIFNFTLTPPAAFGTDGFIRITASATWTVPTLMFITACKINNLIGNSLRMIDLMSGIDYQNLNSERVRFNGLEECIKYWAYYRLIRDSDLLVLRFGNRQAEDSTFSSAMARTQVKKSVYNAESQALKYQYDAERFIRANIAEYTAFNNNTRRRKKTRAFDLNKLPQGSFEHEHFFPTDNHHHNHH